MKTLLLIILLIGCLLIKGDARHPSLRELSEYYPEAVVEAKERLKAVGGVR